MDPNSPASLPNPALTAALEAREADVSPVPINPGPVPTFIPLAPLAPVTPEVPAETSVPFKVPGWAHGIAVALAGLVTPLAFILPDPYNRVALMLGVVLGFLAGAPLKVPAFAEGRPLVPLALVGPAFALASVLATLAPTLPAGLIQQGAAGLSVLLALLAGKTLPMRGQ